jgi:prefoldin subunit 5
MKADGLGKCINRDTDFSLNHRVYAKAKTKNLPTRSDGKDVAKLSISIEQVDQIVEKVSQKLQVMTNTLNQIGNEKDDIIRAQLARFFNVLSVIIDETLHSTGHWSSNQFMSDKAIEVRLGVDGTSITVQGEKIAIYNTGIRELSKSPTSEDIEAMQQDIKKAQASITKLRNNVASAKSQVIHHPNQSSGIII